MQKLSFKAVVGWLLVTIATVPVTKLAESYFDVSLFSPHIMRLWGWVQTVWGWLGSDVSLPVWLSLLLCLGCLLSLVFLGLFVHANWFEKEVEKEPKGAPLTEEQHRAFVLVGMAAQRGEKMGITKIREDGRLSRIGTQNALEHLCRVGLIDFVPDSLGYIYPELTSLGRHHYLELERERGVGQFG